MRKPKSSFSSLKKCSDAWTDPNGVLNPLSLTEVGLREGWKHQEGEEEFGSCFHREIELKA